MRFSSTELNQISGAIQRERGRRKYSRLVDFIRGSWPTLEGTATYFHNWHIELICDHLEGLIDDRIENLLINIPPGCMKSLITSVNFPVWAWTKNAEWRFLTASYGQELATRDAVKSRSLIDSPWFQDLWGNSIRIDRGQNQKTKYQNTAGGWRLATSVGGRGTGEHPDFKIIDDPHSAAEAQSDAERLTGLEWYDQTLSSRGVSRNSKTAINMQRLHEKDLSGHVMASDEFETDWDHLCLPMRFEPGRYTSSLGEDPRTTPGELLWPALFTERKVKSLSTKLGEYGTAGQLQQRPAPAGGGILKTKHFQLWPANKPLPAFDLIIQSYDTAFKTPTKTEEKAKATDPDSSACSVYGLFTLPDKRKGVLVLDCWAEQITYPTLRKRVLRDWGAFYGGDDKGRKGSRADVLLVEDKASGQSLIQDLHQANIPALAYNPGRADKVERAHLVAPLFELDVVWVMESTKRPGQFISWAKPLVDQSGKFPKGDHDDLVDTLTQALLYVKNNRLIEMPDYEDQEEHEVDYSVKRKNPYGS